MISSGAIKETASVLGFELCGVAALNDAVLPEAAKSYRSWLDAGFGASMEYLKNHLPLKEDPARLLPGAASAVCVALSYAWPQPEENPDRPKVSVYARAEDYHALIGKKLEVLAEVVRPFGDVRLFTDAEPVFDRFWAARAGLGWIGKNTCLIHRTHGSYLFLGGFFTTARLEADAPYTEHCGRCRKCVDACPTEAIVQGPDGRHRVNAGLCIGYHTIENKGPVPAEIQTKTGTWLAGCDVCQQVCPWNSPLEPTPHFSSENSVFGASFAELAAWSQEEYKTRVAGTALSRIKYPMFLRNLVIAARNSELPSDERERVASEAEKRLSALPDSPSKAAALDLFKK